LPTSYKPFSCFSFSPLKQSYEVKIIISKDASIFLDLKGRRSGYNLLLEEEKKNSSIISITSAKEKIDLQSNNNHLQLQQGIASNLQEEEKEEQLIICLSTQIPHHHTKLTCIFLSNPHKLPKTTILINMHKEEEGYCCCLNSSFVHPVTLCLFVQKLKKP
jgi:PIN domain nuclease of toxin-antitoxin system